MLYFKTFSLPYEYLQISKPVSSSIILKPEETLKAEVIDILPSGGIVLRTKGGHVTVQTEIPLRKGTQLLLKVMDTSTTEKKIKLQIISILDRENIQINKNALDNIKVLLKDNSLREIFFEKVSTLLKEPGIVNRLGERQKLFLTEIILETVKASSYTSILKSFDELSVHIKNINSDSIFPLILKSVSFIEKKKKMKEDKELSLFINQQNILNMLTGGLLLFIPVYGEDLKRNNLFFKVLKSRMFFCRIDLEFFSVGSISVDILMSNNDLSVYFYVENEEYRQRLQENIYELEKNLKKLGFNYIFLYIKDRSKPLSDWVFLKNTLNIRI